MTEASTSNLRGLPIYHSHEQVYCLHSLARSVHNFMKETVIHLPSYAYCNLIRRRVQQGMYTIRGKASCTLTQVVQDTWYCLHQLQNATRSVRNSRKNPLYTYKVCKSTPSCFRVLQFYTKKNQPYTYQTYDSRPSCFHVL